MTYSASADARVFDVCACISKRPGMRNLPVPSTTIASAGTGTPATGPISAIRPLRTTTVRDAEASAPVIGMTVTFRMATDACLAAQAGRLANPSTRATKRRIISCLHSKGSRLEAQRQFTRTRDLLVRRTSPKTKDFLVIVAQIPGCVRVPQRDVIRARITEIVPVLDERVPVRCDGRRHIPRGEDQCLGLNRELREPLANARRISRGRSKHRRVATDAELRRLRGDVGRACGGQWANACEAGRGHGVVALLRPPPSQGEALERDEIGFTECGHGHPSVRWRNVGQV